MTDMLERKTKGERAHHPPSTKHAMVQQQQQQRGKAVVPWQPQQQQQQQQQQQHAQEQQSAPTRNVLSVLGVVALGDTSAVTSFSRSGAAVVDALEAGRQPQTRIGLPNPSSSSSLVRRAASSTLASIPQELLVQKVFPFLRIHEALRLAVLSKWMRRAIQTSVERYMDTFEGNGTRAAGERSARGLVRRMRRLRRIVLGSIASPVLVAEYARRAGCRLRVFECTNCEVGDAVLIELARVCLGVEVLRFSNTQGTSLGITEQGVSYLARGSCSIFLREVSINNAPGVTVRALGMLLYACPRLRILRATRCGVSGEFEFAYDALGPNAGNTQLHTLDLSFNYAFGDPGVFSLPLPLASLRSLNLSGARWLTDLSLRFIGTHCSGLEELSLVNCTGVTDSGLESFARWCFPREAGGEPAAALPRFRKLDVSRCIHVSDSGLIAVCTPAGAAFQDLVAQGCFRVSNMLLRALGASCPNLRRVNFRGLNALTDAGMEAMCKGCPRLESAGLSSCTALTSASLFALARHCRKLQHLDLSCVDKITDEGLEGLARGCLRLEVLNISWCYRISQECLSLLFDFWPRLRHVVVEGLMRNASQLPSATTTTAATTTATSLSTNTTSGSATASTPASELAAAAGISGLPTSSSILYRPQQSPAPVAVQSSFALSHLVTTTATSPPAQTTSYFSTPAAAAVISTTGAPAARKRQGSLTSGSDDEYAPPSSPNATTASSSQRKLRRGSSFSSTSPKSPKATKKVVVPGIHIGVTGSPKKTGDVLASLATLVAPSSLLPPIPFLDNLPAPAPPASQKTPASPPSIIEADLVSGIAKTSRKFGDCERDFQREDAFAQCD